MQGSRIVWAISAALIRLIVVDFFYIKLGGMFAIPSSLSKEGFNTIRIQLDDLEEQLVQISLLCHINFTELHGIVCIVL